MRIAILAYAGCMGAEVLGLSDLLLVANRLSAARSPAASPPFSVAIIGAREGEVRLAGNVRMLVGAPGRFDLLVVPAFDFNSFQDMDTALSDLEEEKALIRSAADQHSVAAICGGSLLLAEAGVLAGRRATTAWAFADEMSRRYPDVDVLRDAMLVRDGTVITCGAFTAYGELALQLIRDRAGSNLARAVGRFSLIEGNRGSQAPYLDARLKPKRHESIARTAASWFATRLAERYELATLAAAFHLSSRTLLRRFRAETGQSPLELLQDLRVERARHLLETTTLSVAQVAMEVGYQDVSTFSRLFARRTHLTPAVFRRKFQTPDHKVF
ncbi:GlxA family transcriptional regulator [Stenotrophomonas sp. AB1(2024)]|uniref:GlxA family transcriptional regulator n=1 Tax=Stenotrophomonas sp. AB1(2024) TaxID=3132215 RepID=UPI0030B0651C